MEEPPFTALAEVYDAVMADVDYDSWCEFLLNQALARGTTGDRVLELGCGTGNLTIRLARAGLTPVGVDSSEAMLAVARAKEPRLDWRHADFRDLRLGATFPLVVSIFDSVNNLLSPEDFSAMARSVRRHLEPTGLFIFDVNTRAGLREPWDGNRVEGWIDDIHYLWTQHFDEALGLATLTAHFRTPRREFTEVHRERPYEADELRELLEGAGFGKVEILDFPDGDAASMDSPRLWVIAS